MKPNGNNIIEHINGIKPDIMVLVEAAALVPSEDIGDEKWYDTIKLENYKKNTVSRAKKKSRRCINLLE